MVLIIFIYCNNVCMRWNHFNIIIKKKKENSNFKVFFFFFYLIKYI